MRKKTWKDYLSEAVKYDSIVSDKLGKCVRVFMEEKGFSREVAELFDMNFVSGTETVITFDGEGEMCDLDILMATGMTKEEIIEKMSRYLSEKSIKRINGEFEID